MSDIEYEPDASELDYASAIIKLNRELAAEKAAHAETESEWSDIADDRYREADERDVAARMRPPTIYLAGPINGCNDDEANGWRKGFMERLPRCGFLDPMVRDYRGREDESVGDIVAGDQDDIRASDVVVAYCWQPSWGTAMEIYYAHSGTMVRKRVVVVVPDGIRVSPWLRYHSDVVVPTLEAAAQWIEGKCLA